MLFEMFRVTKSLYSNCGTSNQFIILFKINIFILAQTRFTLILLDLIFAYFAVLKAMLSHVIVLHLVLTSSFIILSIHQ